MIIRNFRIAEPKASVPADIANVDSIIEPIPLWGYYVPNTEYFNIMPSGNSHIDRSKINSIPLGYIFPDNPFKSIWDDFYHHINMIEIKIDNSKSRHERLKENRKHLAHSLSNIEKSDLCSYINKTYPDLFYVNNSNSLQYLGSNPEQIIGFKDEYGLHLVQLSTLTEIKQEIYSLKLDIFSRNTGILESDVMLGKRALFIGCGSVGSLVAVELAKAGVGSFLLVDMDIFGYHNICRHQCGIYDVGRFKTDAVADRILQINPYAKIKNTIALFRMLMLMY